MGKFDFEKAQKDYKFSNAAFTETQSYLWTDNVRQGNVQKRFIVIIAVLVFIVIIAVAVGLGVGLHKSSESSSSAAASHQKSTAKTPLSSLSASIRPTIARRSTHKTSSPEVISSTTLKPPGTVWLSQPCHSRRSPSTCPWSNPPLLLVSLDGFRAEYVLRNSTPVIQKLRGCGVHTPYLRAVYPTLTFPNHYTIVTGLYPASHGIVGNSMYDPHINASYSISSTEKSNPAWYGGEPLWTTAKKQGKKTASYFWVGSDVNISGVQPDIWHPYNGKTTFEERVDAVLGWLQLPESDRPDFITLYFDQPDHEAHGSGPDSPQVNAMLKMVDRTIGRLMDGLFKQGMDHCVNLIVLADHGMAPTTCDRQVSLKNYLKDVNKMLVYSGTTGHINPQYHRKSSSSKTVLRNSKVEDPVAIAGALQCKSSHLNVYTPDTIPVRHHYSHSDRIGAVVMDIEQSWLVYPQTSKSCLKGNHGYDNIYKSMHALFLAHGPGFKENIEVEPFENIELYNMMTDLLGIEPAPNNGTRGSLNHLLKNPLALQKPDQSQHGTCKTSNTRTASSSTKCTCSPATKFDLPTFTKENHIPFGIPANETVPSPCLLNGRYFAAGFSSQYKMPAWTSFTLTAEQVRNYSTASHFCTVADPRLDDESNPDCEFYQNQADTIDAAYMYDPGLTGAGLSSVESRLSSNVVPMFTGFKVGIWQFVYRVIREYASQYGEIGVTTGPAFDYNFDGLADTDLENSSLGSNSTVPLPSHFFLLLTKRYKTSSPLSQSEREDIDTMAFILPHKNQTSNCQTYKQFLETNVARIRDVELLTGLRFLSSVEDTKSARMRTRLTINLWPTPAVMSWKDLPCASTSKDTCTEKPPLLLISLDGFRAEYLTRNLTPTIQKLAKCGVHTPYMRAVYPTVTFPNHYTIVTGLYPESHGIIANHMYDEEIGDKFSLSAPVAKDTRWWKGQPLWITAKEQGLKTATYFWPGSDVNISGVYPDIWKRYDGTAGYVERVDVVLSWIDLPVDRRPQFLTLYFDQPDHAGHEKGPKSDMVNGQLQTVDELIDNLMTKLYERNMHNCINIIIVADHGMSDQSCSQALYVKNYSQALGNALMFGGVMGNMLPQYMDDRRGVLARNPSIPLAEIVSNLTCQHPTMKVFTKATLPKRHHYTNSPRIGDVLLDMKDEWLVFGSTKGFCTGGNHGWDNINKNMHALFLAHGPAFKENFTAEPFENIELYNMMCDVLNITAAPNNGTKGSLNSLLTSPKPVTNATTMATPYDTCSFNETVFLSCNCPDPLELPKVTRGSNSELPDFGRPLLTNNDNVCQFHQRTTSTGYSKTLRAPVWLTAELEYNNQTATSWDIDDFCVLHELRTYSDCPPTVDVENVTLTPLVTAGTNLKGKMVAESSSLVPMFVGFRKGVWRTLLKLLDDYHSTYGHILVTMGTIYDYNNDGLWEGITNATLFADENKTMPIPTHLYAIIMKCRQSGSYLPCDNDVDILSFILPNLQEAPNCLSMDMYLKDNVARIRDIELLTGLQFLPSVETALAAKLRTFLPEKIWTSELFPSWIEEPCPNRDLCNTDYKPLLLISLDGFRADYILRNFTPTIARLSQCGAHAPFMRSVYPTKTFPNHYSIVTGLYPESHGIIDNNMFDLTIKKRFSMGSSASMDPRWWGGEPLWLTAQSQGLKAATYFWPGSDVKIAGKRPNIWKKYDGSATYSGRVQEVLSWMTQPSGRRPDFITLYFDEPDLAGHKSGPSQIEAVGVALDRVDAAVQELMTGLLRYNLHHCVNLVIIADHGMADVSCDKVVRLGNLVDYNYLSSSFWVWDGPVGRISNTYKYKKDAPGGITSTDPPESIDTLVTNLTCASPHLNTYTKASLPVRHHYSNNKRIDNIVLDMETGWLVTRSYIKYCDGGNHGYDNIDKSMEALFLAYGPAFKWNYTVEPFENIELYNLFADVLNISAAPNNGTAGSLDHILQSPPTRSSIKPRTPYKDALDTFNELGDFAGYSKLYCSGACKPESYLAELYNGSNRRLADSDHLPFGLPVIMSPSYDGRNITVLYNRSFVGVFDADIGKYTWISRTHSLARRHRSTEELPRDNLVNEKLMETTNTDQSKAFAAVMTAFSNKLAELMMSYTDVNFLGGYAYDNNHDSLPDSNINSSTAPTHYYSILTVCEDNRHRLVGCQRYRTYSYIIPFHDGNQLCKLADQYLIDVESRVRDVEIISGFQFFTSLQHDQALRLRTYLPQRP